MSRFFSHAEIAKWENPDHCCVVNLPNSITLARLFLTIVYVVAASISGIAAAWVTLVAFIIAAATDWLDGYLARKLNLVTALGKLLDPLVDKILVCAAFVHLTMENLCPMWVTILIIGREFLVTGLRQIAIEHGVVMAADRWGKLKTIFQMIFVIAALLWICLKAETTSNPLIYGLRWLVDPAHHITPAALWIALFLTCLSGWNYLHASLGFLVGSKGPKV
jgi:CDP-diacylglycerol--glycerol-3-phosphate 3-phosphatidyltransferase